MSDDRFVPGSTSRGTICLAISGVKNTRSYVRLSGSLTTSPRLNVITCLSCGRNSNTNEINCMPLDSLSLCTFRRLPVFQSRVQFYVARLVVAVYMRRE